MIWQKGADGRKALVPEVRKPVTAAEINRETSVLGQMFKAVKLRQPTTV